MYFIVDLEMDDLNKQTGSYGMSNAKWKVQFRKAKKLQQDSKTG